MRERNRFILLVLSVCSISHFINDGYQNILSPLSPLILKEFRLNFIQLGILISGFNISASILQFVVGNFSFYISKRYLIMGGFLWTSIFIFGTSLASNYIQFLVLFVIAGIGISMYHPSASSIISKTFPSRMRGRAFSIYLFSGRTGAFTSVLLANIIASVMNWRFSLYMWATSGLVIALIVAVTNFKYVGEPEVRRPVVTLRLRHSRRLLITSLVIVYATYEMLARGLSTFIPIYLVENIGVSTTTAGMSIGLFLMCGSVGSILIGIFSDQFDKKRVVLLFIAMSSFLIFLVTAHVININLIVIISLLGVAVYAISPLTQTLVSENTLGLERTRVFGFLFTISEGLGAITPMLMGLIADAYSLQASFYLLITIACAGIVSMLSLVSITN